MQISRACTHAIIKERYVFPKKRNVFLLPASGFWRPGGEDMLASGYRLPASGVIGHGIAHRSPEKQQPYGASDPA
jgi:hypothetical protein